MKSGEVTSMVSLADGATPDARERLRSLFRGRYVWALYGCLGLAAIVVYFLIDAPGARAVLYGTIGASAVAAIAAGIVAHRPAAPRMWIAFAIGLALFVAGDAVYAYYEQVRDVESPFPTLADAFYLAGYPFLAGGILLAVRGRGAGRERRSAFLEAAIVSAGLTVPVWALLVSPIAHDEGLSVGERLIAVGYPAGDFLILAVLIRLVFTPRRVSPAYALLVASIVALFSADVLYAVEVDSYVGGNWIDVFWLISYVLWGAAALHPSMRLLTGGADRLGPALARWRLALLAVALATAPITLLAQAAAGRAIDAGPMIAAATGIAVLVFVRMVDLLHEHERLTAAARELFENATDIIVRIDLHGNVVEVNRAAERMSGFERAEIVGRSLRDLLSGEQLEVVEEGARRMADDPAGHAVYELELRAKDGRPLPIEVNARPVREDGKVVGWEAICRDLTDRRVLEEQLRQAQRMEAVGNLAGGVAHDFNNVLMAIRGYSELALLRLGNDDGAVREEIEGISEAAARASGLTEQLLAFSRKQALQPEIVDVNALVLEMQALLSRLIGADVALQTDLESVAPHAKVDRAQLGQAIVNLAVNARDAMPAGGTLVLKTARESVMQPRPLDTGVLPPGSYVVLSVSDSGLGIDPEARPHIFDPFFTTKEKGKGTGLGLSTVYGVVTQSGGQVAVDSAPAAGATFTIYLPLVPAPPRPVHRAERSDGAPRARGAERVLLVEDDELVREVLRRVLEQDGYEVVEAANGEEALGLASVHEDIELLVTDLIMPGMTGYELARQLTGARPALRVLTITGYAGDNADIGGEAPYAVLQKPFAPDVFSRRVRDLLDEPA
jgi:PAS domain S-box-containing protein